MNAYTYRWSLRPETGLSLELRVTASSVVVARRAIRRFLVEHDGVSWTLECVSRESGYAPPAPYALPLDLRVY